jgi:hypothetical protein
MHIIKQRLTRAVRLTYHGERRHKDFQPRRTSKTTGVVVYDVHLNVLITTAMRARVKTVCAKMNVAQSPLLRDAIEFYVGMCEMEIAENGNQLHRG